MAYRIAKIKEGWGEFNEKRLIYIIIGNSYGIKKRYFKRRITNYEIKERTKNA